MGMFDNLICKYPLPLPEFQSNEFQTKDTPAQFLDLYELREDGTLWHEVYDVEDRSKLAAWMRDNPGKEQKDAPEECRGLGAFIGCMTRVNQRWEQVTDFTGEIRFYNSVGQQHTGWIEFSAYFTHGKLEKLNTLTHRAA